MSRLLNAVAAKRIMPAYRSVPVAANDNQRGMRGLAAGWPPAWML